MGDEGSDEVRTIAFFIATTCTLRPASVPMIPMTFGTVRVAVASVATISGRASATLRPEPSPNPNTKPRLAADREAI